MLDKALAYQLGQVQGQGQRYGTNASRNTTTPAPTELREVGGDNAPSTKSPAANTHLAYTSPSPMREVGNAGLVRPTDGLGFEPDFVDCPNCRKRTETIVNRVASETTRYVSKSHFAPGDCNFVVPCWMFADDGFVVDNE